MKELITKRIQANVYSPRFINNIWQTAPLGYSTACVIWRWAMVSLRPCALSTAHMTPLPSSLTNPMLAGGGTAVQHPQLHENWTVSCCCCITLWDQDVDQSAWLKQCPPHLRGENIEYSSVYVWLSDMWWRLAKTKTMKVSNTHTHTYTRACMVGLHWRECMCKIASQHSHLYSTILVLEHA